MPSKHSTATSSLHWAAWAPRLQQTVSWSPPNSISWKMPLQLLHTKPGERNVLVKILHNGAYFVNCVFIKELHTKRYLGYTISYTQVYISFKKTDHIWLLRQFSWCWNIPLNRSRLRAMQLHTFHQYPKYHVKWIITVCCLLNVKFLKTYSEYNSKTNKAYLLTKIFSSFKKAAKSPFSGSKVSKLTLMLCGTVLERSKKLMWSIAAMEWK